MKFINILFILSISVFMQNYAGFTAYCATSRGGIQVPWDAAGITGGQSCDQQKEKAKAWCKSKGYPGNLSWVDCD